MRFSEAHSLCCRRPATAKGFERAFAAQLRAVSTGSLVSRVNDTRVTIQLPPLPTYALPISRVEHIAVQRIPQGSIVGESDVTTIMGEHSVVIMARTVVVHGTFFDTQIRY